MKRFAIALLAMLFISPFASAQEKRTQDPRWPAERVQKWLGQHPWLVGCNYIPSTAVNQLEMWQADTFDPKTIDRELKWAHELGFTSVRVFLHDLPWKHDALGFVKRIDKFLEIADKHRIRPMFVLLDSCWDPAPKAGKQPAPRPHLHNSGWVQSPGVAVLKDAKQWAETENYIRGILSVFKNDKRIVCWDLWNEPENNNANSYGKDDLQDKEKIVLPLVQQVFGWARRVNPSQPLTAAPWQGDWSEEKISPLNRFLFENSDIISFHRYENLKRTRAAFRPLRRYDRLIVCTEYMARPMGSTFGSLLNSFKKENIGAYCWGFVSGKSQTIYPWDSWQKKYDAEPEVWFHDILRDDGKPFDEKEVTLIRGVTGVKEPKQTPKLPPEKEPKTIPGIEVKLRFSVAELDPLKPGDSFVECTVRNQSAKAVQVPTVYTGSWEKSDMTLTGGGGGWWNGLRLVRWAGTKKQETKLLERDREMIVYKASLREILLLDMDKAAALKPKEERWYWSWSA
jgi:hypothetical protein